MKKKLFLKGFVTWVVIIQLTEGLDHAHVQSFTKSSGPDEQRALIVACTHEDLFKPGSLIYIPGIPFYEN